MEGLEDYLENSRPTPNPIGFRVWGHPPDLEIPTYHSSQLEFAKREPRITDSSHGLGHFGALKVRTLSIIIRVLD